MRIILIGFMGSGKSTVAKLLAAKLGLRVVEMDEELLELSDYKSIPEIFEQKGETFFRELELQVAKNLMSVDGIVISAGGGVVMNKLTMDYLKENGVTVFLQTDFNEISQRLEQSDNRPLFRGINAAKKLFDLRAPLYEYYSDIIVETNKLPVDKVVRDMLKKMEAKI